MEKLSLEIKSIQQAFKERSQNLHKSLQNQMAEVSQGLTRSLQTQLETKVEDQLQKMEED